MLAKVKKEFGRIEHLNNLVLVLFKLNDDPSLRKYEVVLLDWQTGEQIWTHASWDEICYWNAGRILALKYESWVGRIDRERKTVIRSRPVKQTVKLYDTRSKETVHELEFPGWGRVDIAAQND